MLLRGKIRCTSLQIPFRMIISNLLLLARPGERLVSYGCPDARLHERVDDEEEEEEHRRDEDDLQDCLVDDGRVRLREGNLLFCRRAARLELGDRLQGGLDRRGERVRGSHVEAEEEDEDEEKEEVEARQPRRPRFQGAAPRAEVEGEVRREERRLRRGLRQ